MYSIFLSQYSYSGITHSGYNLGIIHSTDEFFVIANVAVRFEEQPQNMIAVNVNNVVKDQPCTFCSDKHSYFVVICISKLCIECRNV